MTTKRKAKIAKKLTQYQTTRLSESRETITQATKSSLPITDKKISPRIRYDEGRMGTNMGQRCVQHIRQALTQPPHMRTSG